MGRAIWDLAYLLLFVVVYTTWNISRHEGAYHDLLVSFKQDGGDSENAPVVPSGRTDEESKENGGEEEAASAESTSESSLKSEEERKEMESKLKATAAKELAQEKVLGALSERFLRPELNVDLDAEEEDANEDEEESLEQFRSEVQQQVDIWSREGDALNTVLELQKSGELDQSSEEHKKLISQAEKQRNWLSQELKRMSFAMRKELHAHQSKEEELIPVDLLRIEQVPDEPISTAYTSVAIETDHVAEPDDAPAARVGSRAELLSQLSEIWQEIAPHVTAKRSGEVKVVGDKNYVSRDYPAYNAAYTPLGFTLHQRRSEVAMSSKTLLTTNWDVLVCLAVDTMKCYPSHSIPKTKPYQRINRIIGLRQVLWNKDAFCNTLRLGTKGNADLMDYTFNCWIIPTNYADLKAFATSHPSMSYILKPLTMGGGQGISVVDGLEGLKKYKHFHSKKMIAQTYLGNPHLIHNRKWDMRTYVLVTSTYPVRAYFYQRGLVRFASSDYDANAKSGGLKTQFLTNTSINKHKVKHGNVTELTWSFEELSHHFSQESPEAYTELMKKMGAAISVVFLSAERTWRQYFTKEIKYRSGDIRNCGNCYQVMGVDLIMDDKMRPRVIEVNGEPSMQLSTNENDHYSTTKRMMLSDVAKMVFGEGGNLETTADLIMSLPPAIKKALTAPMLKYLSEYVRESQYLGGFRKVYPNSEYAAVHSTFINLHRLPADRVAVHQAANEIDAKLAQDI